MTVLISITCSTCFVHADIPPAAVLIDRAAQSVGWICPTCQDVVERVLASDLLDAAANAGASPISSVLDRSHPESPAEGPDLVTDDLLRLHDQLGRDGWYDELASLVTKGAER
jgi:hypothetical protein